MGCREPTGGMPPKTKRPDDFECGSIQQPDLLVHSVDVVEVSLFRVRGKINVECRTKPQGPTRDHDLVQEGAIPFEDLDPIVHPITYVDEPIVRQCQT